MNEKIKRYLGLAKNAGKAVSGEFSTDRAVKRGKAFLVIVAEDASDATKKEFTDMCTYYHVPCIIHGIKDELGKSVGCEYRACVAVCDEGLAKAITKSLDS